VFQPEYLGETQAHPYSDARQREFIVLGGTRHDIAEVAEAYSHVYHASVRFYLTDSRTAELAKYMENCYFATKVVFCNEFMHIARRLGVEYQELREIWLADSRISRDHTFVYADVPGFAGKCLPKDLSGIISCAQNAGYAPIFLKAVRATNEAWRSRVQD
jgi:UDPglucose 6-dehydrogenase